MHQYFTILGTATILSFLWWQDFWSHLHTSNAPISIYFWWWQVFLTLSHCQCPIFYSMLLSWTLPATILSVLWRGKVFVTLFTLSLPQYFTILGHCRNSSDEEKFLYFFGLSARGAQEQQASPEASYATPIILRRITYHPPINFNLFLSEQKYRTHMVRNTLRLSEQIQVNKYEKTRHRRLPR